mmetsp:Transcript_107015/g.345289  ORF Transcript_107015/g.345289 Transcript_107015/m.345289 type:complete len:276 (-) Transcript_107015:1358-2185(-)
MLAGVTRKPSTVCRPRASATASRTRYSTVNTTVKNTSSANQTSCCSRSILSPSWNMGSSTSVRTDTRISMPITMERTLAATELFGSSMRIWILARSVSGFFCSGSRACRALAASSAAAEPSAYSRSSSSSSSMEATLRREVDCMMSGRAGSALRLLIRPKGSKPRALLCSGMGGSVLGGGGGKWPRGLEMSRVTVCTTPAKSTEYCASSPLCRQFAAQTSSSASSCCLGSSPAAAMAPLIARKSAVSTEDSLYSPPPMTSRMPCNRYQRGSWRLT